MGHGSLMAQPQAVKKVDILGDILPTLELVVKNLGPEKSQQC